MQNVRFWEKTRVLEVETQKNMDNFSKGKKNPLMKRLQVCKIKRKATKSKIEKLTSITLTCMLIMMKTRCT